MRRAMSRTTSACRCSSLPELPCEQSMMSPWVAADSAGIIARARRPSHGARMRCRSSAVDRAAQHHVAVRVAERLHRAGPAHVVDAEERVLLRGGVAAVDGGLDGPVGRVLESDRHRHAAGELAVDLRFGVAGADRAPADRVGDELGAGGLQEFRGGGESLRPARRSASCARAAGPCGCCGCRRCRGR